MNFQLTARQQGFVVQESSQDELSPSMT